MTIIGIGYKKRSGKDTVAGHLVARYGFTRLAFADKVKEVTAVLFGWSLESMYDDEIKEVVDPFWGLSRRRALQLMGTEAGRQVFGHDIWIRHVHKHMVDHPETRNWVISDVRFPDEARAIKDWGGEVWRVDRHGLVGGDGHASETSMNDYGDWDRVLTNDGTLGDLSALVDAQGLKTAELKWSWRTMVRGSSFHDEFDSRQAAIDEARAQGHDRVLVGPLFDLRPDDYVSDGHVDWILEGMDEAAELDRDDLVFETDDEGRRALKDLLCQWARRHVTTNFPRVTRLEEEVEL